MLINNKIFSKDDINNQGELEIVLKLNHWIPLYDLINKYSIRDLDVKAFVEQLEEFLLVSKFQKFAIMNKTVFLKNLSKVELMFLIELSPSEVGNKMNFFILSKTESVTHNLGDLSRLIGNEFDEIMACLLFIGVF